MRFFGLSLAACAATLAFATPGRSSADVPAAAQTPALVARAKPTPTPTPTDTPTPSPTPPPTDSPTPTPMPTATPNPHPARYRGEIIAPPPTPTPTATPSPAASATGASLPQATAPSGLITPVPPPALTPIPTAAPTLRAIAPVQPTVPESIDDPAVQATIARPIRELAQVGWMTGTWNAHSVEQLGDGSSRDRGVTTYVFAPTMKGRWLFGADGKGRDYLYVTFDPFERRWVLVRFQGNPSYGLWTSESGWHGNRIEFTSSYSFANGRQYHRRLTIIHKDARTFGIYDEEQISDGSWTPDDYVELTKQV